MISDLMVQAQVHTPCHRKNSQSTVNHMKGGESNLVYKMRVDRSWTLSFSSIWA